MNIQAGTNVQVGGRKYVYRYQSLITDVGGHVCKFILQKEISKIGQNWGVATFLNAKRTAIDDFHSRRILNKNQMDYLFPGGRAATSSETFDITLLMFLFRNFLFRDESVWREQLNDIPTDNTRVIEDLARIRCYRNKVHDFTNTNTSLSEEEFWKLWGKLSRIFLHLGDQYSITGICRMIDKALNDPLDEEREKELDRDIKHLRDDFLQAIDEHQTEMKKMVEMKTLLSKDHGPKLVDDVLADKYFVETEQSKEVLKMLQTNRIIILQGAPGEGKTTLAQRVVKKVSKGSWDRITSWEDWASIDKSKLDAILIDDMFGAGVFDKQESRKWQKYLPGIFQWVNKSPEIKKYVVITSRTYILKKAREQLYLENDFDQNNFYTLSSKKLEKEEKLSILRNHFASAKQKLGGNHFTASNKSKKQTQNHISLLENISKLEPTNQCQPFTIGFPECARLFSNNADLYKKGKGFFQTPMEHVIQCISEIFKSDDDDVFVAFFVLWAQKDQLLTCIDLERPVKETPDCIKIPILKLQYHPEDRIRTLRNELASHAHSEGFVTLVSENFFRFSHNVVRDAVGLNAYRKNATAVLELCDMSFIENYVRVIKPSGLCKSEVSENLTLTLPQGRYEQLSLRIGELTISEKKEAIDASISKRNKEIDKSTQVIKNYTIFKNSIFDSEEFCTDFIKCHRAAGNLEVILTVELRTIRSELKAYKFLDSKAIETSIRLPSFLIWQRESLSVFAKLLFTEMKKYPNLLEYLEKEMSIGMLIGSMFVSREIVEFLSGLGGNVTHTMILLAYETSKSSKIDEPKKQEFIQLLESKIGVAEPNSSFKIYAAAFEGCLDIVEKILQNDPEQAKGKYTALDKTDLKKASLYHIAAYKQNSELIATLVKYEVESNVFDAKERSPFLYAISKGKYKVVKVLHDIAKEHEQEMTPDDSKNTPLHMAIIKSAKERDPAKKTFTDLSVDLLKSCPSKIHTHNSRGLTPLQVACIYNATEVVKEMMIEQKIHLAEEEKTLMHDFVMSSDEKAIELLLKYGFDHNITDSNERTPLMLANELEKTKIAAFIEELTKSHNVDPTPLEQGKNGQNLASNDKQKDRLTYD